MREYIFSVLPRACHVKAVGIKILMSYGRLPLAPLPTPLVWGNSSAFSGWFYGGDKFSFPVPLINRTHRAKYVFDILRRTIPVMELHANTWAVYTSAWYIGDGVSSGRLRVACVRSHRDETRRSFESPMPKESTFRACQLEILSRRFSALFRANRRRRRRARAMKLLTLHVNFSQKAK